MAVTVPLDAGMSVHHTVFVLGLVLCTAQIVVGSVVSVVADELSTVLVKKLDVTKIALAILSFAGGALVTVKVCAAEDTPAVGELELTVTEAVVPKATRAGEIVALIVVAVPPDSMVTPSVDPFHRICAVVANPLPVAVKVKAAEPAAVVVGLIVLSTGVDPPELVTRCHALTKLVTSIEPRPVA